jgi:hypothetical protein
VAIGSSASNLVLSFSTSPLPNQLESQLLPWSPVPEAVSANLQCSSMTNIASKYTPSGLILEILVGQPTEPDIAALSTPLD